MLGALALCIVTLDQSGIWLSFLPDKMKLSVEREIGFDPWGEEIQDVFRNALGVAANGDGEAALLALLEAEGQYFAMSNTEKLDVIMACGDRYQRVLED